MKRPALLGRTGPAHHRLRMSVPEGYSRMFAFHHNRSVLAHKRVLRNTRPGHNRWLL